MSGTRFAASTGRLSVTASAEGGIRVVSVAGEIDHLTGEVLREALAPSGTADVRVVVDMRQVSFMDSAGINVFLTAHRSLTRAGGWLRLAAVGPTVIRTLQIVGLDTVLGIYETREQALAGQEGLLRPGRGA
ncbi:STAS domain-containing protein [Streptomyces sp. NPDC093516]|uniref:STAS domain-containing protein n=1 Tax=Streptomyces sp. NPDC093516 TaxID=3155304 RepID=UPI00343AF29D